MRKANFATSTTQTDPSSCGQCRDTGGVDCLSLEGVENAGCGESSMTLLEPFDKTLISCVSTRQLRGSVKCGHVRKVSITCWNQRAVCLPIHEPYLTTFVHSSFRFSLPFVRFPYYDRIPASPRSWSYVVPHEYLSS